MGQTESKGKKQTKKGKNEKNQESEDDSDFDGAERVCEEASPYIKVKVLYELPGGNTEKREYNIDISKKASELKRDLEKFLNIKEGNIKVFAHNGTVEMPNNVQVRELCIDHQSILRVRDGNLTY